MGCSSFCPSLKPKRSMFVASASSSPRLPVESAAGLLARRHSLQGDKYSACQTEAQGQGGVAVMKDTHSLAFQKQSEPLLRFRSRDKSDPKVALLDRGCL